MNPYTAAEAATEGLPETDVPTDQTPSLGMVEELKLQGKGIISDTATSTGRQAGRYPEKSSACDMPDDPLRALCAPHKVAGAEGGRPEEEVKTKGVGTKDMAKVIPKKTPDDPLLIPQPVEAFRTQASTELRHHPERPFHELIIGDIAPLPSPRINTLAQLPGAYSHSFSSDSERLFPPSASSVGLSHRMSSGTILEVMSPAPPMNASPDVDAETGSNHGLVVALPVDCANQVLAHDGQSTPGLPHARPMNKRQSQIPDGRGSGLPQKLVLASLLLAAIVLLILWGVGVFDKSNNTNEEAIKTPTNDTSHVSPADYLKQFLPSDTLANIAIAEGPDTNITTPQYLAFQWLLDDPSLTLYSEGRLKQRFALASFYFATTHNGTEPWTQKNNWLSYAHHECEWYLAPRREIFVKDFIIEDSACDNYTQELNDSPVDAADGHYYIRLWHRNNSLQGTIPDELYWLTHLKSLDLSINKGLGGTLSSHCGKLTDLELYSFRTNPLITGVIPTQLAGLTRLSSLHIGGTSQHGTIPIDFYKKLTNLEQASFGSPFTGTIPSQIGLLTNLKAVGIAKTRLNGTIPTEFGNLKSLTYYILWGNSLSGTIPSQIGSMSKLAWLNLKENLISGSIPEELYKLSDLQELGLYSNQLTGSVSSHFGQFTRLYETNLGFNQLSGSIPTEIGHCTAMSNLNLERNLFTGPLPSEMGNFADLKVLALANNRFTGPIPSNLGNCGKLQEARWNSNLLTGAIPSQLGLWNGSLSVWDISNNGFSGSLAVELSMWWDNSTGGLKNLTLFNVTGIKNLVGTIPAGLCASLNSSTLGFDCTDKLCGCDCWCQNDSRPEGLAL